MKDSHEVSPFFIIQVMKNRFFYWIGLMAILASCNSDNEPNVPTVDPTISDSEILYVVNAGNFNSSNASITKWTPEGTLGGDARKEVFYRANGFKLGDTAQSATVHGDYVWTVVNNSNIIFAVDKYSFKEKGRISEGITSPRYIHFVSEDKAYVTQMRMPMIAIVDAQSFSVTGHIDIPLLDYDKGNGESEEIVQIGDYAYVNLWSYGQRIIKIDTKTDQIVGEFETGVQPYSMAVDADGYLWVLCDGGGWSENPAGYEQPSIRKYDPDSFEILSEEFLPLGTTVSKLCMNGDKTKLYWTEQSYTSEGMSGGVRCCDVRNAESPTPLVISSGDKVFYSMTVSPVTGDIFVADPIDYEQPGRIYRYSSEGTPVSSFEAGIIPTSYAWVIK